MTIITINEARHVITSKFIIGEIFHSHDFIEAYRKAYELNYVTALVSNARNEHIFRQTNAEIAIFLKNHQTDLGIMQQETQAQDETDLGLANPIAEWKVTKLVNPEPISNN